MKSIRIDRAGRLRDEPHTGHNRWHPDIPPAIEVAPDEPLVLETRDAADGQVRDGMTVADLERLDRKVAHPLTGPVRVRGARPGDLLEVEFLDIVPEAYGWSRFRPGAGFLRDRFESSWIAHWHMADGWARSPQIPGVRIPEGAFMGTSGVAPSHAQVAEWTRREADLVARGGIALAPDAEDAVPAREPIASEGLRTMPPRENGGNFDVKQLTRGARLWLPVHVEGALFSTGDAHYAQGDGEVCVTGIEMGATVTVRFRLHPGEAERRGIRFPRFAAPAHARVETGAFVATMGMPVRDDGVQEGEDLTLAARNALVQMIALLGERGFTPEQAYVICSVAVDLRVSNAVDLPNVTVAAFLPEAIFDP